MLQQQGATARDAADVLLETQDLSKQFGTFWATDGVDLTVRTGEIHALLGENGAGKSTLVKMLFGSLQPTRGQINWRGEAVDIRSPSQSRDLGIGMVFQHFSLFDALTVAENIALSLGPNVALRDIGQQALDLSQKYGLPLDPYAVVGDLSAGERQRVEIIRCLMQDPQLIILDEPTSVLTPQEADTLFATLHQLAAEGRSVLYISHRLEEVQALCSTATILRHGKIVDACDPRQETPRSLAAKMVGETVGDVVHREGPPKDEVVLHLNRLSMERSHPFAVSLNDITLEVHAGELVGIAGIAGNGQSELFEAISGERLQDDAGDIVMCGTPAGHLNISQRRNLGAAFIPEERLGHGAVPSMRLSENLLLARHASDGELLTTGGRLQIVANRTAAQLSETICSQMDVRKSGANPPASALSGGNLQKFIVGRELDRNPRLLIVNQPTWGVDAGAAAFIRQSLIDLAAAGSAVLMISQDLDEIFEVANSIAVIADGQLTDLHPSSSLTRDEIGLMMTGGAGHQQAGAA